MNLIWGTLGTYMICTSLWLVDTVLDGQTSLIHFVLINSKKQADKICKQNCDSLNVTLVSGDNQQSKAHKYFSLDSYY